MKKSSTYKHGYSKNQEKVIHKVYTTLKKAGYDDYAIAGILGNAHTESQFDPDSVGRSHYGLFQNDANVRNAIIQKYGDYSIDSQLKYLMDWNDKADWIRNGDYSAYTAMNSGAFKKTGYKDTQEASNAFMRLYERPVIMKDGKVVGYQGHQNRLRNSMSAMQYINAMYNNKDSNIGYLPMQWDLIDKPQISPPTLPKENPIPFENKSYQFGAKQVQPLAQRDAWNSFNDAAVAYGQEPQSPFRLQLKLPSLDELMAMDSPQEQLKRQIQGLLPIPNIQPVTNIFNV